MKLFVECALNDLQKSGYEKQITLGLTHDHQLWPFTVEIRCTKGHIITFSSLSDTKIRPCPQLEFFFCFFYGNGNFP